MVAPTITQVTPRMLRRIDRRDAQQLATRESAKLLQRAAASVHAPMVSHDVGLEKLFQRSSALNGVPVSASRIITPRIRISRADHAQGLTVLRYLFGASTSSHAAKASVLPPRPPRKR